MSPNDRNRLSTGIHSGLVLLLAVLLAGSCERPQTSVPKAPAAPSTSFRLSPDLGPPISEATRRTLCSPPAATVSVFTRS